MKQLLWLLIVVATGFAQAPQVVKKGSAPSEPKPAEQPAPPTVKKGTEAPSSPAAPVVKKNADQAAQTAVVKKEAPGKKVGHSKKTKKKRAKKATP